MVTGPTGERWPVLEEGPAARRGGRSIDQGAGRWASNDPGGDPPVHPVGETAAPPSHTAVVTSSTSGAPGGPPDAGRRGLRRSDFQALLRHARPHPALRSDDGRRLSLTAGRVSRLSTPSTSSDRRISAGQGVPAGQGPVTAVSGGRGIRTHETLVKRSTVFKTVRCTATDLRVRDRKSPRGHCSGTTSGWRSRRHS